MDRNEAGREVEDVGRPEGLSGSDLAALRRLDRLAYWLDDRFRLPGTDIRIGLDGLAGLVPGVGDAVTAGLGAYILTEAWQLGVSKSVFARMLFNLGVDAVAGTVPVFGDVFDVGWKSHRRNVDLLRRHLERRIRPVPL